MAKLHGKGTTFSIDNAAGSPTDISEYLDNVDFPAFNADTTEVSTFGATQKAYVNGLMDGTISISGPWDATLDAILAAIVGGAEKTYSYKPGGGSVTYSGECVCTSYQIQSPIGGAVTFSANFQLSGTVGRA
jgi:hypothetical protein